MRGELTNEGSRRVFILAIAPSQTGRKTDTAAEEPAITMPDAALDRVALVLEQPILRHHGSN